MIIIIIFLVLLALRKYIGKQGLSEITSDYCLIVSDYCLNSDLSEFYPMYQAWCQKI